MNILWFDVETASEVHTDEQRNSYSKKNIRTQKAE